ncbi:hypothetical protein [Streptomyces lateritius]|uniref:hypothetical protein n=1 Tax=Streptomyces lateritius TaxID=67313 RepID=UPI001C8CB484|nr:hypothetical protein [Streptomyces lateritius]MBX9420904.1 hypothetical protein [Streptomyces lateritius]
MPESTRTKWVVAAALSAALAGVGTTWWVLGDDEPYSLLDSPKVQVDIQAAPSSDSKAQEVAEEAELLIKAYVQRLRIGDDKDLAALGAPWFTTKQQAAKALIDQYGDKADKAVKATVADPVVPYLASVELKYADGTTQTVQLSHADDAWWLQLGSGDPVQP